MSNIRGRRGFTLIELVIVLAVIGVLLAIAVPTYREQVLASRRAEGKALVTDVAARLERCYTRFNRYDHDTCLAIVPATSEGGWYTVAGDGADTATSNIAGQAFTLRAFPQNAQADDDTRCGALSITNTGVKDTEFDPPAGYDCW